MKGKLATKMKKDFLSPEELKSIVPFSNGMWNKETKDYINNLNQECLPWHRMITAYGTAEKYN